MGLDFLRGVVWWAPHRVCVCPRWSQVWCGRENSSAVHGGNRCESTGVCRRGFVSRILTHTCNPPLLLLPVCVFLFLRLGDRYCVEKYKKKSVSGER